MNTNDSIVMHQDELQKVLENNIELQDKVVTSLKNMVASLEEIRDFIETPNLQQTLVNIYDKYSKITDDFNVELTYLNNFFKNQLKNYKTVEKMTKEEVTDIANKIDTNI